MLALVGPGDVDALPVLTGVVVRLARDVRGAGDRAEARLEARGHLRVERQLVRALRQGLAEQVARPSGS